MRELTGDEGIRKNDLNPHLYRGERTGLFRREGSSPPVWYPPANVAEVRPTPSVAALVAPLEHVAVRKVPQPAAPAEAVAPAPIRKVRKLRSVPTLDSAPDTLWEWQKKALRAWRDADRQGIVEAVTGTGKTRVGLAAIRQHLKAEKTPVLVLVPTVVLLEQWKEVLRGEFGNLPVSTLGGSSGFAFEPTAPITVGVIKSVVNQGQLLSSHFGLLVADECHRYGAPSYQNALFGNAKARMGLTALLERGGDDAVEEVLLPYFGDICFRYGYAQARADAVIAPYQVELAGVALGAAERRRYDSETKKVSDIRKVLVGRYGFSPTDHQRFHEQLSQAAAKYNQPEGKAAAGYLKATQNRKKILTECDAKKSAMKRLVPRFRKAKGALVFCETITGAEAISEELRSLTIEASVYHSKLSLVNRQQILEDLVSGKLEAVVAVRSLDEGVDVPKLDLGVIVSASRQRRQMIQRMGRILRRKNSGGGAQFVVLYAKGTVEDPYREADGAQDHVQLLLEHAEQVKRVSW